MKKSVFKIFVFSLISCTFFMAGCEEEETKHTDPSFLIGKWSNSGATFTIAGDYTFVCDLSSIPGVSSPGRVKGKLDYSDPKLGPDDYILRNLTAGGEDEPDATYNSGNSTLGTILPGFNNLIGTLTPSADKRKFTFTSSNQLATTFFGGYGPFNKQ